VPVPDPTKLTTEAVEKATDQFRRELATLREIIDTRLKGMDTERALLWGELHELPKSLEVTLERRRREFQDDVRNLKEVTEQRLEDLDKSIILAMNVAEHQHSTEREYMLSQVDIVRAIMAEKFTGVDGRFQESKVAVDAAFAAAKEAVAEQNKGNDRAITKSETAVKEQLAALSTVTDAGLKGLEDKITDARDRLTTMESLTRGIKEASGDQRDQKTLSNATVTILVQVFVVVIAVAALIVSIAIHIH